MGEGSGFSCGQPDHMADKVAALRIIALRFEVQAGLQRSAGHGVRAAIAQSAKITNCASLRSAGRTGKKYAAILKRESGHLPPFPKRLKYSGAPPPRFLFQNRGLLRETRWSGHCPKPASSGLHIPRCDPEASRA